MSGEAQKIFYFADFEADAARLELRRRGAPVAIQPKPLRLLLHLLNAGDRVVTKRELLAEVWSGVYVSESALSTTVRDLRRALGDTDPRKSPVRTIHGHGYRFVASVRVLESERGVGAGGSSRAEARALATIELEERESELAALRAALADVCAGRGRACLVTGPPGIGKTSLMARIVAQGSLAGLSVHVARGRDDATVTPFWIWTEILRSIMRSSPAEVFEQWIATEAPFLRGVIPGLPQDEEERPLGSLSSEQVRFRFQGGVWRILLRAARERPLLIACDDLQWSDTGSLRVLRFVLEEIEEAPVLLVATLRDAGVFDEIGVKRVVGAVARSEACRKLALRELSPRGVARAIERWLGVEAPPALVTKVHGATSGNPFFVSEVAKLLLTPAGAQLLRDESSSVPLPERVSDAVASRVATLSPACRELLALASVAGSVLDVNLLCAAGELETDAVLEGLSEAEREGLVVARPDPIGSYQFSHAIVRDVLYELLTRADRMRLHGRVALALERSQRGREDELLAELAHHFCAAGPGAQADRALHYARAAADRCEQMYAWVEAERHCREGIAVAKLAEQRDLECELLICQARMLHLGDSEVGPGALGAADQAIRRAGELARAQGDRERLARCATVRAELELGRTFPLVGVPTSGALPELARGLEEAIAQSSDAVTPVRLAAMRQLSRVEYLLGRIDRADERCDEVKRLCAESGLEDELMRTEVIVWERLGADRNAERRAILERLEAYAAAGRGVDYSAYATAFRGVLEMERGNVDAAIRAMDQHAEMFRRARVLTTAPDIFASMLAAAQGRFDAAERSLAAVVETNARLSYPMVAAGLVEGVVRRGLACARGEPEVGLPLIRMLAQMAPAPIPRIGLLHALTLCGERAEVESLLEEIDLDAVPRDSNWLALLAMVAEAAALVGARSLASPLYGQLLPYADLFAMQGWFAVCLGSVSLPLALLARTIDHDAAARKHFEQAIQQNGRIGARPLVARTQLEYASLLERGDRHDRELAGELRSEARKTAEALGIRGLFESTLVSA